MVMTQKQLLVALLGILVAAAVGTGFWLWQGSRQAQWKERPLEGLQVYGRVPAFSLIERSGRPLTQADLNGKIWIANFIYTNCPDTCPVQTAQMKELQTEFMSEKDLRLVSITVDPKRDTVGVLSEYADRFGADPERWLFLTGEREAIYRLAQAGFHLAAAEIPYEKKDPSGATHTHSPRFVLVSRNSEIRGYYPSTDAEAMARLRRDLRTVLQNER